MKICTKCHLELPETSFNKSRRNKSGLRAECRECQRIQYVEYRGEITRNFGGSRYIRKVIDGRYMSIHRIIAEQKIGRPLELYEVVHHINGDKKDNRPENLEVMTVSEHSRMENIGRKHTEEWCRRHSEQLKGRQTRFGYVTSEETKHKLSISVKAARANKFWSSRKSTRDS